MCIQKHLPTLSTFAVNVWCVCVFYAVEHFRAINDAQTSSVVFILYLPEQTANQELQIRFTFISEFPWGPYDSVALQMQHNCNSLAS